MSRSKALPIRGIRPTAVIDGDGVRHDVQDSGRHRRRSLKRAELVTAWVADRIPMAMRGRIALGGREVGFIALVGALGLCAAAVLMFRSSAAAATPALRAPELVSSSVGTAQSRPKDVLIAPVGASARKQVVVDVAGGVRHPKVVTLPAGSRVFEALKAAGGVRRGVDVTSLNLARVLVDGEQILVGRPATAGVSVADASSVVSLNQASESDLDALPGVGPVTAKSIVAWRQQHGAFTKVDELQEVEGIGPKTFAKLKPLVGL